MIVNKKYCTIYPDKKVLSPLNTFYFRIESTKAWTTTHHTLIPSSLTSLSLIVSQSVSQLPRPSSGSLCSCVFVLFQGSYSSPPSGEPTPTNDNDDLFLFRTTFILRSGGTFLFFIFWRHFCSLSPRNIFFKVVNTSATKCTQLKVN